MTGSIVAAAASTAPSDRLPGGVDADDDQQVGARGVGHPRDLAGEGHRVAVDLGAGRVHAVLAGARVDRPALDEVAGRPRGQPRRAHLARGHRLERVVFGGVQQRTGGQQPEQRRAGEHAPALLCDQHRVEGAEAGAAVLLGHEQARPAGLDHGRPQVGQRSALERVARGLDRLDARQRAARGLAQELLLVGQCEVHTAAASFSFARSSLNGTPLSRRGSGGSPSTRSPIVLRRISSVPPADFRPGRNEIM